MNRRAPAVAAVVNELATMGEQVLVPCADSDTATDQVVYEHCVVVLAEEVTSVEMAFAARLVSALNELSVVEAGA